MHRDAPEQKKQIQLVPIRFFDYDIEVILRDKMESNQKKQITFQQILQSNPVVNSIVQFLSLKDRESVALVGNHALYQAIKVYRNKKTSLLKFHLDGKIILKELENDIPAVLKKNLNITGIEVETSYGAYHKKDAPSTHNEIIQFLCETFGSKLEQIIIHGDYLNFANPTLTMETAQAIVTYCEKIKRLDLHRVSAYQEVFEHLTKNISTLNSVCLSRVKIAPKNYITSSSDYLHDEHFLTDQHISPILQNNKGLDSITLSGADIIYCSADHHINITNKTVETISALFAQQLKHLELSGCARTINPKALIDTFKKCRELEVINLYATNIDDEVIKAISTSCPTLRKIHYFHYESISRELRHKYYVTNQKLEYLLNCSNLEEISELGSDITDEILIAAGKKFTKLKFIDLTRYSPHVTIQGIKALLGHGIETLKCNIMNITGDDLKELVEELKKYNSLEVTLHKMKDKNTYPNDTLNTEEQNYNILRELSSEDILTLLPLLQSHKSSVISMNFAYQHKAPYIDRVSWFQGTNITDQVLIAAQEGGKQFNDTPLQNLSINSSKVTTKAVIALLSNCCYKTAELHLTLTDDMTGENLKSLAEALEKLPKLQKISLTKDQMLTPEDQLTIAMICSDNKKVIYKLDNGSYVAYNTIRPEDFIAIKEKHLSEQQQVVNITPTPTTTEQHARLRRRRKNNEHDNTEERDAEVNTTLSNSRTASVEHRRNCAIS